MSVVAAPVGASFRFLDLPIEIRFMVYERLPVRIKHTTIEFFEPRPWPNSNLTLISRSLPMSILATCRSIYEEAYNIVQLRAAEQVTHQPPRFIYTCTWSSPAGIVFICMLNHVLSLQQEGGNAGVSPEIFLEYLETGKFPDMYGYVSLDVALAVCRHNGRLRDQLLRFIKQAAAYKDITQQGFHIVCDLRNKLGKWSHGDYQGQVAFLDFWTRIDADENRMTFAGFITELGYEGVPKADLADDRVSKRLVPRFEQMDIATWRNEWLESDQTW